MNRELSWEVGGAQVDRKNVKLQRVRVHKKKKKKSREHDLVKHKELFWCS